MSTCRKKSKNFATCSFFCYMSKNFATCRKTFAIFFDFLRFFAIWGDMSRATFIDQQPTTNHRPPINKTTMTLSGSGRSPPPPPRTTPHPFTLGPTHRPPTKRRTTAPPTTFWRRYRPAPPSFYESRTQSMQGKTTSSCGGWCVLSS